MRTNGGRKPVDENCLWSPSFLAILERIDGVTMLDISFCIGVLYVKGG